VAWQASACGFRARDARGLATNPRPVIRIPIPIDIGTIAATGGSVFAAATPLRLDQLVALAVHEALGTRAPLDKRERSVRTALDGLHAGKFVVDVDGRVCGRGDDVIVCAGTVTLRFFSTEPRFRVQLR
jgi:hypothetical protein